MLEIEVHEIRGYCPVYKVGDKIVIEDPEIDLEKTDAQTLRKFNQNASRKEKLYQKKSESEVKRMDCSKAIRDLKHDPKVTPEEGIKRTVEWMKNIYLKER